MRAIIARFVKDESGSVIVGEWVFVATILMLGVVAGAVALHPPAVAIPDDAPAASAPAPPEAPTAAPATDAR